jgi:hypothetical protein
MADITLTADQVTVLRRGLIEQMQTLEDRMTTKQIAIDRRATQQARVDRQVLGTILELLP